MNKKENRKRWENTNKKQPPKNPVLDKNKAEELKKKLGLK